METEQGCQCAEETVKQVWQLELESKPFSRKSAELQPFDQQASPLGLCENDKRYHHAENHYLRCEYYSNPSQTVSLCSNPQN